MAKLIRHPSSYVLPSFVFLFLLVSTEMAMVEVKVSQRRSKTWSGFCGNSGNCNRQCRNEEGAAHGPCHAQFPGFACFCYFNY